MSELVCPYCEHRETAEQLGGAQLGNGFYIVCPECAQPLLKSDTVLHRVGDQQLRDLKDHYPEDYEELQSVLDGVRQHDRRHGITVGVLYPRRDGFMMAHDLISRMVEEFPDRTHRFVQDAQLMIDWLQAHADKQTPPVQPSRSLLDTVGKFIDSYIDNNDVPDDMRDTLRITANWMRHEGGLPMVDYDTSDGDLPKLTRFISQMVELISEFTEKEWEGTLLGLPFTIPVTLNGITYRLTFDKEGDDK